MLCIQHTPQVLSPPVTLSLQLGPGTRVQEGLLTSDARRADCFSQKCYDMATSSRQQKANHAKLAAYLDEKPENVIKRKKLMDKQHAYEEALLLDFPILKQRAAQIAEKSSP